MIWRKSNCKFHDQNIYDKEKTTLNMHVEQNMVVSNGKRNNVNTRSNAVSISLSAQSLLSVTGGSRAGQPRHASRLQSVLGTATIPSQPRATPQSHLPTSRYGSACLRLCVPFCISVGVRMCVTVGMASLHRSA